jgi:hypothetical protein
MSYVDTYLGCTRTGGAHEKPDGAALGRVAMRTKCVTSGKADVS